MLVQVRHCIELDSNGSDGDSMIGHELTDDLCKIVHVAQVKVERTSSICL